MASKRCPKCGLLNHETALRCDCGYDFPLGQMKESYLDKIGAKAVPKDAPVDKGVFRLTWLNFWIVVHFLLGAADLLFGVAILLGFMGFEPSIRFMGGLILVLSGFFFLMMTLRLLQRRRSGLTMSYIFLLFVAVASLGNIAIAMDEDPTITGLVIGIVATIPGIGICWLWWRYLKKREHWFQPAKVYQRT